MSNPPSAVGYSMYLVLLSTISLLFAVGLFVLPSIEGILTIVAAGGPLLLLTGMLLLLCCISYNGGGH